MTEHRDLLEVISDEAGRLCYDLTLRRGETLGWKSIRPDFTTRNGFRWPFPGGRVASDGVLGGACPSFPGDGYCVAKDPAGAGSGGIPLHVVLLLAWRGLLGEDGHKLRVKSARVLALVDLRSANLCSADLRSADLYSANLCSADLYSADLRSADLYSANLCSADLRSADLRSANLCSADLRSADLRSADLRSADLYSANLCSARYDQQTLWPEGFDPAKAGAVRG